MPVLTGHWQLLTGNKYWTVVFLSCHWLLKLTVQSTGGLATIVTPLSHVQRMSEIAYITVRVYIDLYFSNASYSYSGLQFSYPLSTNFIKDSCLFGKHNRVFSFMWVA